MRALAIIFAILVSLPAGAVEISNFKSGLACTKTKLSETAAPGWICHQTVDVLVTDQGTCTYNGEERLCTWIGFEFDYSGADKDTKLQCTISSSEPVDSGNPAGLIGKGLRSEDYEISLALGDGHYFNPQYFVFNARTKDAPDAILIQQNVCHLDGKVLFENKFNLRFPVVD